MKCPKCQADNRQGIKFCEECGAEFELECPACKAKISAYIKYCGECGNKLTTSNTTLSKELSVNEKIAKIQRYLPRGLTKKILSEKYNIEGERKQVTVMFCDMVNFTQLSESIGPEETYTIMDQVYEILIHKVHDFEGTVNEMTGDGILALFGAPIAIESAHLRAIQAAAAIHKEIAKLDRSCRNKKKFSSSDAYRDSYGARCCGLIGK